MNEITSPAARIVGAKWNLADWIMSHFPPLDDVCYVEPYCGGASVFLRKPPSVTEVLNDRNGEIINFFDMLRERTANLVWAIKTTPYSRAELNRAKLPATDPLERARRFYIRSFQSFSSGEGSRTIAWRIQMNDHSLINRWNKTSHLWDCAQRLKNAQLECDTAEVVISRFDTLKTLFYVDPPYVWSTRTAKNDYAFEMDDEAHKALAQQLNQVKGMVVLSGYDSELYQKHYSDWHKVTTQTDTVQKTKRTECLWINRAAVEATLAAQPKPQKQLF